MPLGRAAVPMRPPTPLLLEGGGMRWTWRGRVYDRPGDLSTPEVPDLEGVPCCELLCIKQQLEQWAMERTHGIPQSITDMHELLRFFERVCYCPTLTPLSLLLTSSSLPCSQEKISFLDGSGTMSQCGASRFLSACCAMR